MPRVRIRRSRPARRRPDLVAQNEELSLRSQLGLAAEEPCEILVVGSAAFCSFIKARLARLGYGDRVGVTSGPIHAQEAIRAEGPWVTIVDLNLNVRSGGVDLAATIQNECLQTSVVLLATRIDSRSIRDLGYKMSDEWSVVARRPTDNGDPLELAINAVKVGRSWVDTSISSELQTWRIGPGRTRGVVESQLIG